MNFHGAPAAFTVSPESRVLSCRVDLPEDSGLYAVSVPQIRSGAGLAHRFALRLFPDGPSRFRHCLRLVLVSVIELTYRIHLQGICTHAHAGRTRSGQPDGGYSAAVAWNAFARSRVSLTLGVLAKVLPII